MSEVSGNAGDGDGAGQGEGQGAGQSEVAVQASEVTQKTPQTQEAATEQSIPKELNALFQQIKDKHPDKEFGGDDDYHKTGAEYFTKIHSEMDGLNDYKKRNTEANQNLISLLEASPQLSDIIRDMYSGAEFSEAFARNVDMEKIKPVEGDPNYDKWSKNVSDYKTKQADREKIKAEFASNKEATLSVIGEFVTENNLSEKQASNFLKTVDTLLNDVYNGKVSKPFLSMMHKGINHDQTVEAAAQQALIKGKNETITNKIENESQGDNLPKPTTSNKTPEKKQVRHEVEDIVDSFNKNRQKF